METTAARRTRRLTVGEARVRWKLPDGVDPIETIHTCHATMDGVQLRWLREPGASLTAMWRDCERTLFPSPLWDGCK
ncbi:hypothetical protein JS528_10895 [Bifidobacterium sp. MA2]|uniref:Uncharacterized protein n=1 Tax=Bifidobacterium santillanense TaxID=2809028 RepID=A0ABS5USC0_9BIFI|nr:hypothetical protein [Bifidobacterium santillanense]MBT1173830.1 hypothetical protein [Bifidobacterium santillanense]